MFVKNKTRNRSSSPEVLRKNVVFKSLAKFTGKNSYICVSFLVKLHIKKPLGQVFSIEFCEVFMCSFIYRRGFLQKRFIEDIYRQKVLVIPLIHRNQKKCGNTFDTSFFWMNVKEDSSSNRFTFSSKHHKEKVFFRIRNFMTV